MTVGQAWLPQPMPCVQHLFGHIRCGTQKERSSLAVMGTCVLIMPPISIQSGSCGATCLHPVLFWFLAGHLGGLQRATVCRGRCSAQCRSVGKGQHPGPGPQAELLACGRGLLRPVLPFCQPPA